VKSKFRVVKGGKPAGIFQNLEALRIPPDDDQGSAEAPESARGKPRQRAERLQPLPEPYVRIPLRWLSKPDKDHVFEPEARLFLLVLYRSHWGQRRAAAARSSRNS
jgi:hypothetical protein